MSNGEKKEGIPPVIAVRPITQKERKDQQQKSLEIALSVDAELSEFKEKITSEFLEPIEALKNIEEGNTKQWLEIIRAVDQFRQNYLTTLEGLLARAKESLPDDTIRKDKLVAAIKALRTIGSLQNADFSINPDTISRLERYIPNFNALLESKEF